MRLRGTIVGAVNPTDLEALVQDRVGESRFLDFKESLPGGTDEAKRNFLADVTAFANTDGGVLVYGMRTTRDAAGQCTGVAEQIVGLGAPNLDNELLRLQNMLHDGVSPSLRSQVRFQEVTVPGVGGPVLLVGVPKSAVGPHRISFNRHHRFYRRSENGNYEPDVPELRRMFLEGSTWVEEADKWRTERVNRIRSGQASPRIAGQHHVFLHVLPLGRLDQLVDVAARADQLTRLRPLGETGHNWRFNADGVLMHKDDDQGRVAGYTQVLRFGGVEGFSSAYAGNVTPPGGGGTSFHMWAKPLEEDVPAYVKTTIQVMQEVLDRPPPYGVLLGVYGIRGALIPVEREITPYWPGRQIDVDDLVLPVTVIQDSGADLVATLRPTLDIIWQSAGRPGSPYRRRG